MAWHRPWNVMHHQKEFDTLCVGNLPEDASGVRGVFEDTVE